MKSEKFGRPEVGGNREDEREFSPKPFTTAGTVLRTQRRVTPDPEKVRAIHAAYEPQPCEDSDRG